MTLNGLEKELREQFPKHLRGGSNEKINFVRFADDFIVTGKSKEVLENEVKPLVEQFMKERGLTLCFLQVKSGPIFNRNLYQGTH
jgi:RNA-directed DNA polymerase